MDLFDLWIIVVLVGSLVMSVVTWRGRSARARKAFLDLYRRPYLPTIIRNAWMVIPILVASLVTAWLGVAIVPNLAESGSLGDSVAFPLAFGAIGLGFAPFGAFLLLASRPPVWLVPRWLPEDDRRAEYEPPRLDRFDRA